MQQPYCNPFYRSASSRARAALSCMLGSTCEYVYRVMATVACPSISETNLGFGVDVTRQKQRRTGVPEVVEADGREIGLLKEQCKGSLPEVGRVNECASLRGEDAPTYRRAESASSSRPSLLVSANKARRRTQRSP